MAPVGQVSPDGKWFWDGRQWVSALSPDGMSRWNGAAWVATAVASPGVTVAGGFLRRVPGFRSHVPWKMGVAAVTYFGIAAIIVGSLGASAAQPPSNKTGQVAQVASPSAAASAPTAASPTPLPAQSPSPSPSPVTSPTPKPKPVAKPAPKPAATPYAAAKAAGATAVCADGTWSFSQHRSGTCSHHGGVHWWTGNLGAAGPGGH